MRKRILAVILTLIVLVSSAFSEGSKEDVKPAVFKIGFSSSLSGTFAGVAEPQRKSFLLAVEEINAAGGLDMPWGKVSVEYVVEDDQAKLDVGVRKYREMLDGGINALTGGIWNPMSAAINEEAKVNPTIYIPGYVPAKDLFLKGNPAACTFTPTFTPWSIGYITGQAISQNLKKKTIFLLKRADSWGTTIEEGLNAACKKYGMEIVAVEELPAGTVDYSAVINKALKVKPDVFVSTMFGGDAIANLKQAYDMGLYDVSTIFNVWTANVVAKGIPENALAGSYSLAWFYYDLTGFKDKEIAAKVKAYTDAYMKMWNEPPDNMGTSAYVAAKLIFKAVETAGTFDPDAVAATLQENQLPSMKGDFIFRADHQPINAHASFC
jgi:ABC-type branched-subunit amino acid transport system substrate-binding protein